MILLLLLLILIIIYENSLWIVICLHNPFHASALEVLTIDPYLVLCDRNSSSRLQELRVIYPVFNPVKFDNYTKFTSLANKVDWMLDEKFYELKINGFQSTLWIIWYQLMMNATVTAISFKVFCYSWDEWVKGIFNLSILGGHRSWCCYGKSKILNFLRCSACIPNLALVWYF